MKNVVKIIAFIAGLYFLLEYMLPDVLPPWLQFIGVANEEGVIVDPLSTLFIPITNFLMVLTAMAVFLGPINLTRSEIARLFKQREGWHESIMYLVGLIIALVVTGYSFGREAPPETKWGMGLQITYDAIFYGVNMGFYITSMGLVSFYLVSAAHRAFLLNSVESTLMMISATIVMLGLTPAGDYLNQFLPQMLKVNTMTQWILGCPNTAVQKAVLFGTCGGAFVAAMRNWLSIGKGEQ